MGNIFKNSLLGKLGIFDEGGMLGGPASHPSQAAQAAFIGSLMAREGELYPVLKKLLGQSKENADLAYGATVGEANKLYPEAMAGVSEFKMSPESLAALNRIRSTRIGNTDADVNSLISSKLGDFATRGVTSADTAAGMGRSVDTAMLPVRNQENVDYQNQLLTMPSDIAMKKYGLGVGQGAWNASALNQKYKDVLNPYLDMWRTTAGLGATPPSDTGTPGQSQTLASIANLIGSLTADKNKQPAPNNRGY